jgi:phosphatidylinositol alpha-mannosyltransferase
MPSKNIKDRRPVMVDKLKIAYLLDDTLDKPDGVQQCVITIGEQMRSLGHEVHYIVAQTDRTDLKNVHSLAKFVSLKFNGNSVRTPLPVSKMAIQSLLSKLNIDVLHVQMPFSPYFAGRVIRACDPRVRIVGTWHTFPTGGLQQLSHRPLYWMIRSALERVRVTIGVSQPTSAFADSIYRTRSITIPNAVDLHRFSDAPHATNSQRRIVFLGRFDERKGPVHLIKALGALQKLSVLPADIEVIMGGKGPDLARCIELAEQLGLSAIITFPGFIEEFDKPSLLASADICVFPSTGGEAFGISIVEAMASGNSIVLGGDNAGYRSILGEKPELLFDPYDTSEFASKILHYLTLSEAELRIKKKWLKESARQYDTEVVCNQLLTVYRATSV